MQCLFFFFSFSFFFLPDMESMLKVLHGTTIDHKLLYFKWIISNNHFRTCQANMEHSFIWCCVGVTGGLWEARHCAFDGHIPALAGCSEMQAEGIQGWAAFIQGYIF